MTARAHIEIGEMSVGIDRKHVGYEAMQSLRLVELKDGSMSAIVAVETSIAMGIQ